MSSNKSLSFAIIFATLAISGSLIYLGLQFGGGGNYVSKADLPEEISKGIDAYIKNQQADYEKQQEQAAKEQFKSEPVVNVEGDFTDDDPFMGDKDAPVVMVEFSDYECPFCNKFRSETLPKIKENYIDKGKVKFIYRDLPISKHPAAYPSALLAECVREQMDDEAYFKMHDKIFDMISGSGYDYDELVTFAESIGADKAKLKSCFDDEKFKDEIYADLDAAHNVGIDGTPGFIINGRVVAGALPFGVFEDIIEEALKASK